MTESSTPPAAVAPRRFPHATLMVQLFYSVCLFVFSIKTYGGRFDAVAGFCIVVPFLLVLFSIAGLRGMRGAIFSSIVAHAFLVATAAFFCWPDVVDLWRGVESFFGPLFLMVGGPILLVSLTLALSLTRYLASSRSSRKT